MSNATPAQSGQAAPVVNKEAGLTTPPTIRNRKFSKRIVSETSTELVLEVKHTPHKGEKISNTTRKDHKFNPNQRYTAGRRDL